MFLQAELQYVVPASDGRFDPLQQNPMQRSICLKQAIAVCDSLTRISKLLGAMWTVVSTLLNHALW